MSLCVRSYGRKAQPRLRDFALVRRAHTRARRRSRTVAAKAREVARRWRLSCLKNSI